MAINHTKLRELAEAAHSASIAGPHIGLREVGNAVQAFRAATRPCDVIDLLDEIRDATVGAVEWRRQAERLKAALADLVPCVLNPGDGGEFEDGELPPLDEAKAALAETFF